MSNPVAHANIGEAIAAAMAEVKTLNKDQRNTHGNYKYAGIEQYLDHLRPVLGQHGVVVIQECMSGEVQDGFLVCQFQFTLLHGSERQGPFSFVASSQSKMGAQAWGAAASYGLKFFLRSMLLVSADDVDVDAQEQATLANGTRSERRPRQQMRQPPPGYIPAGQSDDGRAELRRNVWDLAWSLSLGNEGEAKKIITRNCQALNYPADSKHLDLAQLQTLIDTIKETEGAVNFDKAEAAA